VYIPPHPSEAIVFAGDVSWSRSGAESSKPRTCRRRIVGVHRAADETRRLHEYSPGFDPARFAAHEKFFVEDVGAWVRSRFGITLSAERSAVCGVRQAANSHSRSGCDIPNATAQSSRRRPVADTGHLT
jgi:hypothetical protein